MVGTKIELIPGYSLFFTNYGQKKLYELLGLRSHRQFMTFLNERNSGDMGLSNEEIEKIVLAGLSWEHKSLSLEETADLIERYYLTGKGFDDLNDVIIDSFCESGLMDKKKVAIIRKLRDQPQEEIEKQLMEYIISQSAEKNTGADTDFQKATLT